MFINAKSLVLMSLLLACIVATTSAYGQDKWDLADSTVRRLPPTSFSELPKPIVRYLKLKRCTIPQLWYEPKPHNVIRDMFARRGQFDWAVLCSRNKISTIFVFWNGSTAGPSQIAKAADKGYLQTVGGGENGGIGFSRVISVAGK